MCSCDSLANATDKDALSVSPAIRLFHGLSSSFFCLASVQHNIHRRTATKNVLAQANIGGNTIKTSGKLSLKPRTFQD